MMECNEKVKSVFDDELERLGYLQEKIARMTYNSALDESFNDGKIQGHTEGMKEGLEKGISQGVSDERKRIAKKLLCNGISIETVSEMTSMNAEELDRL